MNYLRAGGLLCLLLVSMAAVLPMGASAQADAPDESVPLGEIDQIGHGAGDSIGETGSSEDLISSETVEDALSEDQIPPEIVEDALSEDMISPETVEGASSEGLTPSEAVEEMPMEDAPMEDAPMDGAPLVETPPTPDISPGLESIESEKMTPAFDNDTLEEPGEGNDSEEMQEEELSATDRIWREGVNPDSYTWTPQTFSGFFYDLDDDVGTETLTVNLRRSGSGYDRTIREGDLKYETKAASINFEFDRWGEYKVIGFMAQKYFAGYVGTASEVVSRDISLLDEEELRQVLIDDDNDYTVDTGSVLPLKEGYEIRIKEIDLDGNKVWLALAKDGQELDSRVIDPRTLGSSTFKYEVDLRGEKLPLVMAHVSSIFRGAETSLVTIDGIFQISDRYTTVASGDTYGSMEVSSISGDVIEMTNDRSITLRAGRTVPVMGDVSFLVADAAELRFGPTVKRTGDYEIRGTIVDPTVGEFTWNSYNFEGFYYDIDEDVGTETLTARFTGDRINDGALRYRTEPQSVEFDYAPWGSYNVIGFLAEKYFAGYNDDTVFTNRFSVLNEEQLRRVLIDDDESYTVRSGAVFPLEEGYELRIREVDLDGNKVFLSIAKDGDVLDSRVVDPGRDVRTSTFTYDERIGGERVPIIAINVVSVFRGREEDLATIEGIFQVSDRARSVESRETYGRMEIDSVSDAGIEMSNDGSISLVRGRTIPIMENLKFRVSDSDRRLVVPIVEVRVETKPMRIDIPEAVVGTPARFRVTSDGNPVIGAVVTINGDEVGTTDVDGVYVYSPTVAGSFEIEAKKVEYRDVKGVLVVSDIREERFLAITSPQEALKGESFVIKATIGVDMRPVEGADISFGDAIIGTTDALGTVSYASGAVGAHTITASKAGYESGSRKIVILTPITVTGLDMPDTSRVGKNVEIRATAENRGPASDEIAVEMRINGIPEATATIALEPGETGSFTFEYKPQEPGLYTVEVRGVQRTLVVEEKSGTGMILGIFILLFAIGGGAYLYSTGRLNEVLERIKNR
jgi:S-layer protein (TIGR01567 family)